MAADAPFNFVPVEASLGKCDNLLLQYFLNQFRKGYIRAGPHKVVLPVYHLNFAKALDDMEIRNEDVFVVSHPKTGTTWTQEMVWCIANDLDYEGAKQFLPERFPFLEHSSLFDYGDLLSRKPEITFPEYVTDSVKFISELPSPRFIKTHIPWELLPRQIREGTRSPKIIYVARNAKDTCVSYYHHSRLMEGYKGNFQDFCKLFLEDSLTFSPFWSHVMSFWNRRDQPNILFLKYEDMKKDLPSVIRKTADFLGKTLNDEQVETLADHLSFQNMKNNKAVNYEAVVEINKAHNLIDADGAFMRSGKVGEWKAVMTPELSDLFDHWTEKNLAGTGLAL
ncbi:luciferin sulfotransferase [Anabrus simplex]|uniref:luciferin sulfotransferase n=1 Tax=Anabrus simplex TaxID=316456 RepID=UPI0035A2E8D4